MKVSMAENIRKSWKKSLKTRPYEEHKHCLVCGRAVPLDQDFCSLECKDSYGKADKKKSRSNMVQIAVFGVLIVVMFLIMSGL